MFVSLDEQKKRLAERLERPDKYWKYNPDDVDERLLWPKYQEAYQAMLERTSTDYAPWHVVPCDRKWYSRLAIIELLIEALEAQLVLAASDFDHGGGSGRAESRRSTCSAGRISATRRKPRRQHVGTRVKN